VRARILKHVDYEGLGSIETWLASASAQVSVTELYREPRLPATSGFDWLIVMGGPMSVNDVALYPWLDAERELIGEAIASDKIVLGICLGAQLIASALGARVYANREPEVGWHGIELIADAPEACALSGLPCSFEAFHWHEDTFDLPPGASRLARSRGCENQAFAVGGRVLGLQFHLEVTPGTAGALIRNSRLHSRAGAFVQSQGDILSDPKRFEVANVAMATVLENLAKPPL
jgi:GMP synthase-like glutamine amidotransferase